jgi:hypothetical protein
MNSLKYRDMVVMVRDRVQAIIKQGGSLERVKAGRSDKPKENKI